MTVYFRPLTSISMKDLFDGRLENFGVREHANEETNANERCLTDGHNFLWVSSERGLALLFTGYTGNRVYRILQAIGDEFDVEIVSEDELPYFETKEQADAFESKMKEELEQRGQDFYNKVVAYIRGERYGIRSMDEALEVEIARRLIAESPELRAAGNRANLIKAVEMIYREHADGVGPF